MGTHVRILASSLLRNIAILSNIDYIDFITQSMGSQDRLPTLFGTCMIACWPHTTHKYWRMVSFPMLSGIGSLNVLLNNALQTNTSIKTTPLSKSMWKPRVHNSTPISINKLRHEIECSIRRWVVLGFSQQFNTHRLKQGLVLVRTR